MLRLLVILQASASFGAVFGTQRQFGSKRCPALLRVSKVACYQYYADQYIVKKEECVGHIQKRMGTAKRKNKRIKLADEFYRRAINREI